MKEKNADMYEKMARFIEDMRWAPEANTTPIIADHQFGTDPHNIGTLDGSVRHFSSWNDVTWVYMPINAGGVHWVTGAINLTDSIFYDFDSMESESRMLMLKQQVNNWTPLINNILETRGYFNGTGRRPHNFRFSYNELFGYQVPQQKNAKDY
nr:hypothetical protein [Tanacetum cinerariifolium]